MNVLKSRRLAVQLHVTSLPEGTLGPGGRWWLDRLAKAGVGGWQVLPLGPPDEHRSPYKSASAFAGWAGLLADPQAPVSAAAMRRFRERERYWLDDWAEFAGPGAVEDQVRFDREWGELRAAARERGIWLIGDLPIYVAPGSCDHMTHPELFRDDALAGVPPDEYADKGQLWGNPLYDWPALRRSGFRWWVERLRRTLSLFDVVRIDHFRGFVAAWEVPVGAKDARGGHWRRGPGRAVFDAIASELGDPLPLIAEDLGVITPAVTRLRRDLGLPGMLVLQFHPRVERYPEDVVAYTGTHDSDTARGWWESLEPHGRRLVERQLERQGIADADPWWALIRLAASSPAPLAVIQAQDALGLGSEARMNMPGVEGGNWGWRMEDGTFDDEVVARLRSIVTESGR